MKRFREAKLIEPIAYQKRSALNPATQPMAIPFFHSRRWIDEVVLLAERRTHFLQQVTEWHNRFAPA